MSNKNLTTAKKLKNDEYYTQYADVEAELSHYVDYFRDKVVYCNCDEPDSAFVEYMRHQPIKKLLRSSLAEGVDFRSDKALGLLGECDVVVTNPPFSLFREYVAQLVEYDKKFIIIGSLNVITYKEIFPLLKNNEMWLGATCFNGGATYFIAPKELYDPQKMSNEKNSYIKDDKFYWRVNGVRWFTNLNNPKRNEKIILYKDIMKRNTQNMIIMTPLT